MSGRSELYVGHGAPVKAQHKAGCPRSLRRRLTPAGRMVALQTEAGAALQGKRCRGQSRLDVCCRKGSLKA